jgi:tRNA (guanine37-N1)-methyltransferase
MFQAQVFTLYPEVFPGPLSKGLYGKALSNKLWDLSVINIRDAATDKHKTVDDTPYGGGTGMLLKADVLANALDQKVKKEKEFFIFHLRVKNLIKNLLKIFLKKNLYL